MGRGFIFEKGAARVETTSGPVRGYEYGGLSIFKGIPYARARRFHMPEEAHWSGEFDATSYGPVCPLLTNDRPGGELYVPHRFWPTDEDCLNLNIWTPGLGSGARPVLVWLHGGGFEAGSAIEHIAYDGANLARLGDVVLVTVNHRLNILGYFDLSDFGEEYANSANAGTEDIAAALRWINRNIAAFGGDPGNVTVFGQSGGGAKVTALLQSPSADGLISKGVIMSGVIDSLMDGLPGPGGELAGAVMGELGVSGVRDLESADYRALARAYLRVRGGLAAAGRYVGCCPRPNSFYAGDPNVHGFREETRHVPLMVGSVFSEFLSFAPVPYDVTAGEDAQRAYLRELLGGEAKELMGEFASAYPGRPPLHMLRLDSFFRAPEIAYIAKRAAMGSAVYSYIFDMDQPINGSTTPWHCSDIPYFFHNTGLVEYPQGGDPDVTRRVETAASQALLSFAREGVPSSEELPPWPPCRPGEEHTMLLGPNPRVAVNHDHRLMAAAPKVLVPAQQRLERESLGNIQH